MGVLERIYFFHKEITENRYPNASSITREFEVSRATAHRDITYLRDRLLAPLCYDSSKGGYYYEEKDFRLPFEDSPRLLFFLAILHKLAEESGLSGLKEVEDLKRCLGELLSGDFKKLIDSIYCERIEVEYLDTGIFEKIIQAFYRGLTLEIVYQKVGGNPEKRIIHPLRLINYQGRWYILAFCELRNAIRLFHASRIIEIELGNKKRDDKLLNIINTDEFLEKAFGIFKGDSVKLARILFTGIAADIVNNQKWHKDQRIEKADDGIILSLPVADLPEIMMKVLQFGSNARVLEPPELVEMITKEIRKMYENTVVS